MKFTEPHHFISRRKNSGWQRAYNLNFNADVARHLDGESRDGFSELFDHFMDGLLESGRDLMETLNDKSLVDRIKTGKKFRRMMRLDSPRFQRFSREVFQIEGHDNLAFCPNGSSEDMPILRVIGDASFNSFEAFDQSLGKVFGKLLAPIRNEGCGPSEFFQCPIRFIKNPVAPVGQIKPRVSKQREEHRKHAKYLPFWA